MTVICGVYFDVAVILSKTKMTSNKEKCEFKIKVEQKWEYVSLARVVVGNVSKRVKYGR